MFQRESVLHWFDKNVPLNSCYSDVWEISGSIYNCSKLKIGSSRAAGCSCCLQLWTRSELYFFIHYLYSFFVLLFEFSGFLFPADLHFFVFGELQLPDSWGFVCSELIRRNIWCSGTPYQPCHCASSLRKLLQPCDFTHPKQEAEEEEEISDPRVDEGERLGSV